MMKLLTIFLLIGIWLCFLSCGEEKTSAPTIVKDTKPPTIIATNVQGGPIPTNTPIVLVFNERVNLTSAQRGILVRSSIDAETIKGVITLEKEGREVKFTPTEQMTSGAYVLTVLGIEDIKGNVLMTPFSIFFSAVEVDTTQPPADIIPPRVVNITPAEGQSVKSTGSLVVRFDEEVSAASAEAGIVVSGAEGTVEVNGAVAIFKPQKPMTVGKHTLVIVGIQDLAGNAMEYSLLIPFEVIAPPPEIVPPNTGGPNTGRPPKGGFAFEAEDFDAKKGKSWQIITPPATVKCQEASEPRAPELPVGTTKYDINEASGDFIGNPDFSGVGGDWVKYVFNVPAAGDWYIWAKVIAPTIGDNSWFIGIDIPDNKAVSEDNADMNIWDFFESAEIPDDGLRTALQERFTTDWVWFRLNSRTGNPFPGLEIEQYGPNPTPLRLKAGKHTFHFAWREHSFCDMIFGTMDVSYNPNKNPAPFWPVEPRNKLTTTWSQIKQDF